MPQADSSNGLRYALGTDRPSIAFHTQNLVNDLRNLVGGRWLTAAARDLVVKASLFTPAGIPEGLKSYILGRGKMEYDGAWNPEGPHNISSFTLPVAFSASSANNNRAVPSIDGYTYVLRRSRNIRVSISGLVFAGDTAGQQYRLLLQDDAGTIADIRGNITVVPTGGAQYLPPSTSQLLSRAAGTHTMNCQVSLVAGSGTVTISSGLTVTISDESASTS
jgi:hypothetical protein